jgi:hypothetical protein
MRLAAMVLPMTPKKNHTIWSPVERFSPQNETSTRSEGSSSPAVEAPIRDSIRTLAALGAEGMTPEAARRDDWRAASAEAAAAGFPAAPAASAAIVAACKETASPGNACRHRSNQSR